MFLKILFSPSIAPPPAPSHQQNKSSYLSFRLIMYIHTPIYIFLISSKDSNRNSTMRNCAELRGIKELAIAHR